jgi:aminoglycoside/choline kinase family phosphotransferase
LSNKNSEIQLTPSQIDFCKKNITGFSEERWHASLAGKAGSDRSFLRIAPRSTEGTSIIMVLWDSHDMDWNRFFEIHKQVSRSVSVLPEIYASDQRHGLILEEDCGPATLKEFCINSPSPDTVEKMYLKVIDTLITWQSISIEKGSPVASRALDKEMLLWETEYFSNHCVCEYCGLDSLLTDEWEAERNRLADDVAALPRVCLHRDFQSENIMVKNDILKFVDYQGARLGPAEYDLASLLYDPYVSVLTESMRDKLLDYYIKRQTGSVTAPTFKIAAIQRLTQALGAYGNLSLHKGKEQYKQFVPVALKHLSSILENENDYPCLLRIVGECLKRVA